MEEMDHRLLFVTASCLLLGRCTSLDLYEGFPCQNGDISGVCTLVLSCPPALKAIYSRRPHGLTRCGFSNYTEIVCCPLTSRHSTSDEEDTRNVRKARKVCDSYTKKFPIAVTYNIVGGENADLGEFPHMAALGFYIASDQEYRFDCGGTLISARYVLTAAHCIVNIQGNEPKIVRLGVVDLPLVVKTPNVSMDYNVANVTVHREYKWKHKLNDIALVKLEKEVQFSNMVRPACLYTRSDDPEKLMIAGWGTLFLGGNRSDILQKAELTPVSLHTCNETYYKGNNRKLSPNQICAANAKSDACQGDSGGPLQISTPNDTVDTIVGITSYGIGCGSRYPGVYTRISSYLDWIEDIVWP